MQSYVVEEFYRSVCKSPTRASELMRGTLKGYTYFYTGIYNVKPRSWQTGRSCLSVH